MASLEELLNEGKEILALAKVEEAGLDAWLLLEYKTGKSRAFYYAHPGEGVSEDTANEYRKLIKKRAEHVPCQHLTHQAYFMGYEFYVDEHVLIPRQDTEILVEEALKALQGITAPRILDMCTGSGCILLSLLLEKEGSSGVGADISKEAVSVAKRNRDSLLLEERAHFIESNLFFDQFFQKKCGTEPIKYDMLISNPPYIRTKEIDSLMEEVRLHDPRLALDGKEDGLYFYRSITKEAGNYLKSGGWLFYEIGYDQAEAVKELMTQAGFINVQVKKDLAGLDRVVSGRWI